MKNIDEDGEYDAGLEPVFALLRKDYKFAVQQGARTLGIEMDLTLPEGDPAIRLDVFCRRVRLEAARPESRLARKRSKTAQNSSPSP